jgi:ribonuclease BN (tRNA processing enzyme)
MEFGAVTVTAAQLQHRLPCWGYVFEEVMPPKDDAAGWKAYRRAARKHAEVLRILEAKRGAAAGGEGEEGEDSGGAARRQRRAHGHGVGAGLSTEEEEEEEEVEEEEEDEEFDSAAAAGGHGGSEEEEEGEGEGEEEAQRLLPRRVAILGDTMDSTALAAAAAGADLLSHEATYARGMEAKALRAQHSTAWMAGQFARAVAAKALVLTHFSARYKALGATAAAADSGAGRGARPGGGRGGGRRGPPGGEEEAETDQGTLQALIDEAAAEFGSGAVRAGGWGGRRGGRCSACRGVGWSARRASRHEGGAAAAGGLAGAGLRRWPGIPCAMTWRRVNPRSKIPSRLLPRAAAVALGVHRQGPVHCARELPDPRRLRARRAAAHPRRACSGAAAPEGESSRWQGGRQPLMLQQAR